MTDQALHALADAAGLLVDWEDADGNPQTVTDANLRTILAALGHGCDTPVACKESIEALAHAHAANFVTADVGAPVRLPGVHGKVRLRLESGAVREVDTGADGVLPAIDEPGYHGVEHHHGSLVVAVAPARCAPLPAGEGGRRPWGASVQIYALRGEHPTAFGDFGALAEFGWAAAERGMDALAISPVHALFTADPGRYSPYSPSSREYLNPLFIDPALIGIEQDCGGPGKGDLVDWAEAWPCRMQALRRFHDDFFADPDRDESHFRAFVEIGGERLRQHALFEALHGFFFRTQGAGGWQEWPADYQDPNSDAVARFAKANVDEIRFHSFLQWLADASLGGAHGMARARGMAIGLVADLAVGLDPGGSHAWGRRGELLTGLGIGAPPDAFQAAGQNWGLTSFSPEGLKRTGFAPFIRMLRAAMRHAGAIRIDHALGLRRLWLVPEGASPMDGAYLQMPEEDLLRLIALESQRAGVAVIGEDLGVVPPGFRDAIAARGISGMRVLPFERDKDGAFRPNAAWERGAVAMTSTHDLVPVAGWWRERDLDWRTRLTSDDMAAARAHRAEERSALWQAFAAAKITKGKVPAADAPETALEAALAFTAAAPCDLALFPAEDLLGIEEAPNLPGTIDEHPNWRRRLPGTAEALLSETETARRIALINEARAQ
ncbi:4-alpha-glucanotransferase [Sphingosinicella sp. BN140058]|uniref:4-alpha-glucanotransferase n=1 Tax=Sphingosinicella sp. BN140058 TaxID=1892855 RepID=UPI001012FB4B|nr:4-alpha-glucanotransferase [Sphingosinicella sp. BN140058]QAY77599.1 4-alpha-glucanotransferase [Sphingosinicella sp. BN140058]